MLLHTSVGHSPSDRYRISSNRQGQSQQGAILSKLIQAMAPRKINITIGSKDKQPSNTVM